MRCDVLRHNSPCQWYNRISCSLSVLAVTAAVTAPLRQAILRPDLPLDACVNSYDRADGALHLAAFETQMKAIVGVGSILPDPLMDEPLAHTPACWVIHAMAVHPDHRRLGVGAALLSGLVRHACQTRPPAGIRLDSLPSAIGFYRRYGFAAAATRHDDQPLPMHLSAMDCRSF